MAPGGSYPSMTGRETVAGPCSLESGAPRFAVASGSMPLGNLLLLGFSCPIRQS